LKIPTVAVATTENLRRRQPPEAHVIFILSRRLSLLATLSILLALAGCASSHKAQRPEAYVPPPPEANVATIVISTGASEKCISTASGLRIYAKGTALEGPYTAQEIVQIDHYLNDSEFTGHHGYLNVVSLPAGSYYFSLAMLNPYAILTTRQTAEFTVKAGEVAYFGEFFLTRFACSWGAEGEFRDRSDRDIPLLERRNPGVAKAINRKFIPEMVYGR
jgi:hypothetical protein